MDDDCGKGFSAEDVKPCAGFRAVNSARVPFLCRLVVALRFDKNVPGAFGLLVVFDFNGLQVVIKKSMGNAFSFVAFEFGVFPFP